MAETCVANAMEALVRKADSLVAAAGGESIIGGIVVTDIKQLSKLVQKVVTIVSEAEKKPATDKQMQDWLDEVNYTVSMADDLLDECAYDIHRLKGPVQEKKRNKVRNFFSLSNPSLIRSGISQEIRVIIVRLESILARGSRFSLVQAEVSTNGTVAPETFRHIDSPIVESRVVQESNEVQRIVEELLHKDTDKDLSFVSLVGWGGVGKTTLARLVYKNVGVMYHFDERMWVQVSVQFKKDKILKDMFTSLTRTRSESASSKESIMRRLHERLKGKRYLLVLDDIWEENISLWDSLIKVLLDLGGSRGSKVMLTTSVEEVAKLVRSSFLYQLKLDSDDYCWTLFEQIAFAEGGATKNQALVDVGRAIVKECRGNPLYIKLIASLMYNLKDETDWSRIKESEKWMDLSHGVPRFCYDGIPSISLRRCLLYCTIFPKGSVIEREELIQLWMAQGFLNPAKGSDLKMEDVGAKYHDSLLQSSILQAAEGDEFDRKSCKMHDLLRGFALSTSEGHFSVLENVELRDDFNAIHLSLLNCKVENSQNLRDAFSKLKTLRLESITGSLGDILMCAKDLRVLIVVDGLLDELPSSIGTLKRLKYLDISRTKIVRLPDSIAKLHNLQTLRLFDLQDLPKNFENLDNLRHFYVENFKDSTKMNILPPKFRGLVNPSSSKASFKAFLDNECRIEKLEIWENPDRYSSLSIYRLENLRKRQDAANAKLSKMTRIESLRLHWNARRVNCYDEDVLEGLQPHPNVKALAIENFKGSRFPSWMVKPDSQVVQNLVNLELENCSWCKQLPPLGHLPLLKVVKIIGMDNVNQIGIEFYGFKNLDGENSSSSSLNATSDIFPALKELTLHGMASLVEWYGVEDVSKLSSLKTFPFLEKFEVEQCPKLVSIPDIVSYSGCKYLRRLEIALCNNLIHLPEGLGRIESLEELEMRELPSLPQVTIGCGNNLRSLTIGCFAGASEDYNSIQHALHLKGGGAEITSLPGQLQHLSALRHLTIWGYDDMEDLPEWLTNLNSLQILKLEFCRKLMYFPSAETMQQLSNLNELNICYCPLLEERCTRGSRPEWYKISHIPIINVNYEPVDSQS